MIATVDFLSRYAFEARTARPQDAAISIGDPDQDTPAVLSAYGARVLRVQFLDIEPEICWKHGIDIHRCMTRRQSEAIAGFLRGLHLVESRIDLIVHCEAGVSRSAAVALAAAAFAKCGRRERDASFANTHVSRLLGDELGINVTIPPALGVGADASGGPGWIGVVVRGSGL